MQTYYDNFYKKNLTLTDVQLIGSNEICDVHAEFNLSPTERKT